MPDYANGKVYRIVSDQTDKCYIGSTTRTLSQRMASHRSEYKLHLAGGENYITSFEILNCPDAVIELVENCPCDNIEQLHACERKHIESTANCVNRCIPGRTKTEYRIDNKDKIAQYQKGYSMQYRADNAEVIAASKKRWCQDNKERLVVQARERFNADAIVICECGASSKSVHLNRHQSRKIHFARMDALAAKAEPIA